jgi:hypothetical protein
VAYYRVSTDRQGRSGLGLEAQREAVLRHLAVHPGTLLGDEARDRLYASANVKNTRI